VSRRPAKLDSLGLRRGKTGIDSLANDFPLKFRNGHEHIDLKSSNRVGVGRVDSLARCNQSDPVPVQFIENERQMR
jgi:hypothetical protein